MITDGGLQNPNGSGNVPSHNAGGDFPLDYLVNQSISQREFGIFNARLIEQLKSANVLVSEFRSLLHDRSAPLYVINQLHGQLMQRVESVAGMGVCTPRPWMEEKTGLGNKTDRWGGGVRDWPPFTIQWLAWACKVNLVCEDCHQGRYKPQIEMFS